MPQHPVLGYDITPIDPICHRLITAGLTRPAWPYKGEWGKPHSGFVTSREPPVYTMLTIGGRQRDPDTGILWTAADEGAGPQLIPDLKDALLIGWLDGALTTATGGIPFDTAAFMLGTGQIQWSVDTGRWVKPSIVANALRLPGYYDSKVEALLLALERVLKVTRG